MQDLDRDLTIERRITAEKDNTHPAATKLSLHLEIADLNADRRSGIALVRYVGRIEEGRLPILFEKGFDLGAEICVASAFPLEERGPL